MLRKLAYHLFFSYIFGAAVGCDKTITVNVTSNGNIVLPVVSQVILVTSLEGVVSWLQASTGENYTDVSRTYTPSGPEDSETFTVRNALRTFQVNVSFNESIVTCRNITLDVELLEGLNYSFSCVPVSNCSSTVDNNISSVYWGKRYSRDSEYQELQEGVYVPPENTRLDEATGRNTISLSSIDTITNGLFTIDEVTMLSVGYYKVYYNENGANRTLHSFVIFTTPSGSVMRSKITVKGTEDPYHGINCFFNSFPPSKVSWTKGDQEGEENATPFEDSRIQFLNINERLRDRNFSVGSDGISFTYTLSGGLEINDLQYSDAGWYYCTGDNEYGSVVGENHLRVRDPLRPLWPALGIIAVFFITALFIVAGHLWDKIRDEKDSGLKPEDINAAFTSRNSVRTSLSEEDGRNSSPTRRTSSTVQLLPKSS